MAYPLPPASIQAFTERNLHLEELARWARAEPGVPSLLAADLNITPFAPGFRRFIDMSGLQDGRLGRGLLASWPSFFRAPLRVPIARLAAAQAEIANPRG